MPKIVSCCGVLSACLAPRKKEPSSKTDEGRRGGNCLDGTYFIGLAPLRDRKASKAEPGPRAAVLAREISPSNDSGRIGRGHTPLRFRRPPVETEIELVYDTPPLQPANNMALFRHTGQVAHLPPAHDTRGMATLNLSGSERISSIEQVREIQRTMGDAPLVVVDLRQESHAAVSGFPVTWRGPMDWANMGMDLQSVMQRERDQIAALSAQDSVTLTHADYLKGKTSEPAPYHLTGLVVRSEQEMVEAAGATYRRIAVADHVRPERLHVDQFIQLTRDLPPGAALHVHCNGGRGRTTTFMVLYDMLRNAREVGADAILARQAFIGYEYNLTDASMVRPEKVAFLEDRLAFLHEFHAYARENPGGHPQTWSEWRQSDRHAEQPPASGFSRTFQ